MLLNTRLERLTRDRHFSLLCQLTSSKENEGFLIRPLMPVCWTSKSNLSSTTKCDQYHICQCSSLVTLCWPMSQLPVQQFFHTLLCCSSVTSMVNKQASVTVTVTFAMPISPCKCDLSRKREKSKHGRDYNWKADSLNEFVSEKFDQIKVCQV